ncbi:hypothetical protein HZB04_03370 [Candidatus Wolfebacteria bacterium]|nr:hypothetical protein [Candidatus Wolfebacteria bacterium]
MKYSKKTAIISIISIILLTAGFVVFEKTIIIRNISESIENFVKNLFFLEIPPNSIEVITDKDRYKIGEEIFFAVQNKTEETFKIENECPSEPLEIYKLENNFWRHLKASSYIQCKNNKTIILHPYELLGASYLPWEKLIFDKPGKYKLKLEIIGYKSKFEKEIEIIE